MPIPETPTRSVPSMASTTAASFTQSVTRAGPAVTQEAQMVARDGQMVARDGQLVTWDERR
jgi:hypothetical protein